MSTMESSTFEMVRKATGLKRPPGNHGCNPVEIVPGVWTAHFHDIKDLQALQAVSPTIKTVVNSAIAQCPTKPGSYGKDIEVILIDLLDDPGARKIADAMEEGVEKQKTLAELPEFPQDECAGDAKQYFDKINHAIEATKLEGGGIMIHCHASLSRSAAFIIAYMMKSSGLTVVEAVTEMKSKWDATWPCNTFVHQLIEYEAELKTL